MLSSFIRDPYAIAKYWTLFCLLVLGSFLMTQKSSYMEMDAFAMWILSCLVILYLARKKTGNIPLQQERLYIILGCIMCLMSFISIPIGLSNPPYSIGEISMLLSGIGVIVFSVLGLRTLILPVSIPFLAVVGYGGYEAFVRNQEWITAPMIPVLTTITHNVLLFLGINSEVNGNVITFLSQAGSPVYLSIVSDCTGIWSLGTFTVAVIIILSSFPSCISSKKTFLLIAIGYAGTVLANMIRILMIALAGYFFGPSGVIENVHVHIGWIVFSLWMVIFWYYFFTRQLGIVFFKKDGVSNNDH